MRAEAEQNSAQMIIVQFEVKMNFNHLMENRLLQRPCCQDGGECYWAPTGNIRAMVGGHVNVTMYCKKCGSHEEVFLSETLYKIQEKILEQEVGNV
jgi:hypothetical protein